MSFTGTLLPENGVNSLTDINVYGAPPGRRNQVTANSPTRFPDTVGSVDLACLCPARPATTTAMDRRCGRLRSVAQHADEQPFHGDGADGSGNGTVDGADYKYWRALLRHSAMIR